MSKKIVPEVLSSFVIEPGDRPEFRYLRRFYEESGPRAGIESAVLAKLTPAGYPAARHDLLLPDMASGEYADLAYLLHRYDQTLPDTERTGFAQYTIDLDVERPVHACWEEVRAWVRVYFVQELQLAALMVLHMPHLAGSANASHIHILIPGRKLTVNGFGMHARSACSDEGYKDALASWLAHQKKEAVCAK